MEEDDDDDDDDIKLPEFQEKKLTISTSIL